MYLIKAMEVARDPQTVGSKLRVYLHIAFYCVMLSRCFVDCKLTKKQLDNLEKACQIFFLFLQVNTTVWTLGSVDHTGETFQMYARGLALNSMKDGEAKHQVTSRYAENLNSVHR